MTHLTIRYFYEAWHQPNRLDVSLACVPSLRYSIIMNLVSRRFCCDIVQETLSIHTLGYLPRLFVIKPQSLLCFVFV